MTKPNPGPVRIFVSYSHKDEAHRVAFHEAVDVLHRRNLVSEWFDGKIVPGKAFEPELFHQLSRAEIAVLLLSPSYVASEFCWGRELKAALEQREHRDMRVVGVLVRPVHLEGTEICRHKLLPKDKRAVTTWTLEDEAWEDVCKGLEQVITDLRSPSQVDDALDTAKAVREASSAQLAASREGVGRRSPLVVGSVGEFWRRRRAEVTPYRTVCLEGTFSEFAPMLAGPPAAKRDLHKTFRQLLQNNEKLRRRKARSLDACLSVSAGQLVWRVKDPQSVHGHYGLYDSIVRNSVSVMVTEDYRQNFLAPLFASQERKTFEARVTGRVIPLDTQPIRKFIHKHAGDFVPKRIVDAFCSDVYGLLVDGDGTGVERIGHARYLDGDIWIAVESGGKERFLTAFLDVANPEERKAELNGLFAEAKMLPGPPRLFAQYDDEQEFTRPPAKVSRTNQFLDSIWRFGFGT